MFLTLVNMFYSNLNYKYGIITSKVRNYSISFSLEEFAEICDLPCTSSLYKPDEIEAGDDFNFVNDILSFWSYLIMEFLLYYYGLYVPMYSVDSLCGNTYPHPKETQYSASIQNPLGFNLGVS